MANSPETRNRILATARGHFFNQGFTKVTMDEMSGGTFTITNGGVFGSLLSTPIINPPQAAILAVGAAVEKPVVRDGEITIGHEMTCTLSADHRVIDGAVAATYLQTLKTLLESPAAALV